MDNTIKALKNLYVALGGNLSDIANLVIIPDLINAIAEQSANINLMYAIQDEVTKEVTILGRGENNE